MNRKDVNEPWTDKHGQVWINRKTLAERVGVTSSATLHGEKMGWVKSQMKRGLRMFPSPQSEEAYRLNSPKAGALARGDDEGEVDQPPIPSGRGRPPTSLQSASTVKVKLASELLRLEYETKLGKLVPLEAVAQVWLNAVETCKKALSSIPDRIAPEYGGKNHHALYRALTTEITHALSSLNIKHEYKVEQVNKGGRRLGR